MVLMGPGAAPFGDVQKRAHALCHSLPGAPRQFPITYGLCLYHWGRAELRVASELASQLLAAARARPTETEPAMAANNMSGMIRFHRGDAVAARTHLEESVAHYQPQRDAALYPVYLMDFGVFGRFYLALATFVSGDADRARQHARDAFELAGGLNQPHTLGFSMLANFVIAVLGDDAVTARQFAEQCIAFSSQLGFPEFIAMARVARGWATAREGQLEAGLADLDAGIAGWQATGFENWQSWFAVLRCEILAALGRHDDALAEVERQFERIEVNGEDQFRSLLLAEKASLGFALQRNAAAAVVDFDRAAELARSQGAVAWAQRIGQRRTATLAEVAA
jgi:tetratricopeptide (TPR) repeat protein